MHTVTPEFRQTIHMKLWYWTYEEGGRTQQSSGFFVKKEGARKDFERHIGAHAPAQAVRLEDFGHNDLQGTVAYRGFIIATMDGRLRRWVPLTLVLGATREIREAVYKAVSNAIWALPNDVSAGELRKRIGEELGL